jgi:hypothetical protein
MFELFLFFLKEENSFSFSNAERVERWKKNKKASSESWTAISKKN